MVAVDAATVENGCLEVALPPLTTNNSTTNTPINAGCISWLPSQVPLDPQTGCVTTTAEAELNFAVMKCVPGDILIFSGYLPHRSAANNSNKERRALFLTYNRKSEGDLHASYYAAKHEGREGFDPTKAISFQADFQGKLVE
jgi:hypothetical protein